MNLEGTITDTGIVSIRDDGNGQRTIVISAGFRRGKPHDFFAVYSGITEEPEIDPGFEFTRTGRYQVSKSLGQVTSEKDGHIMILPVNVEDDPAEPEV